VSSPPAWLTVEDVASYLDLPTSDDDNLALSTAAVKAAVERRRSDLWLGDPAVFTPGDDVHGGAVRWASLMYQARSAGASDAMGMYDPNAIGGANRAEIMRLLGWRRPEAV